MSQAEKAARGKTQASGKTRGLEICREFSDTDQSCLGGFLGRGALGGASISLGHPGPGDSRQVNLPGPEVEPRNVA